MLSSSSSGVVVLMQRSLLRRVTTSSSSGVSLLSSGRIDIVADMSSSSSSSASPDRRFFSTKSKGGNGGGGGNTKNASSSSSSSSFRPRRRPSSWYRPVKPARVKKAREGDWSPGNPQKYVDVGKVQIPFDDYDDLDETFGPLGASAMRSLRKEIERSRTNLDQVSLDAQHEEHLRMADYLLSEPGSTEDLIGERRALEEAFGSDVEERDKFMDMVNSIVYEERLKGILDEEDVIGLDAIREKELATGGAHLRKSAEELLGFEEQGDVDERDPEVNLDPNQLAHGEWSEMLVTVDRNVKLWRGGRLESYRALVIGGNMNGCGGFGVGKALDPLMAVDVAGRKCKRNIFFVDRYQNNGITRDLVGKQNSCIVRLRATDNGLRGNELCREILKRFGITNAVAKSHGNRNPFNVVRATFKALMTHESIEDIALKRGKRIVSIERAMRMQV